MSKSFLKTRFNNITKKEKKKWLVSGLLSALRTNVKKTGFIRSKQQESDSHCSLDLLSFNICGFSVWSLLFDYCSNQLMLALHKK